MCPAGDLEIDVSFFRRMSRWHCGVYVRLLFAMAGRFSTTTSQRNVRSRQKTQTQFEGFHVRSTRSAGFAVIRLVFRFLSHRCDKIIKMLPKIEANRRTYYRPRLPQRRLRSRDDSKNEMPISPLDIRERDRAKAEELMHRRQIYPLKNT